jgi:hypothetical protein
MHSDACVLAGGFPCQLVPSTDAAHHMLLDQPTTVIASITTVLALWEQGQGQEQEQASAVAKL